MYLSHFVNGGSEQVLFAGKYVYDLAALFRCDYCKLLLVRLYFDATPKIILSLIFLRLQLLAVKFRPGFDINPDTNLVDDSRDVLTTFADCGRYVFIIYIDDRLLYRLSSGHQQTPRYISRSHAGYLFP